MAKEVARSRLAEARRRQIEQGFYETLTTTPYGEISVSDLCQKLGVTRKVFYKHYRDREDCLRAVVDDILRRSLVYTAQNIPGWGLSLEAAVVIMEYWKKNRGLLDIVARDHLLELFVAQALEVSMEERDVLREMLSCPEMSCDMDILACYLGCHFSLVFQWHARDFDSPVEEMAQKYLRLVRIPLFAQGKGRE